MIKMNDLISVIIPVYNVAPYVDRCIESVIKQTYTNIEILLIDDGSTDESGQICDRYQKVDKRIQVYHKKNGGLSYARNYGIDRASGKYITFIDSDDYVSKQYVFYLYTMIKKYDADLSICAYKESRQDNYEFCDNRNIEECIDQKEAFTRYCYQNQIAQNAWGKLYAKFIFHELRYPLKKLYEDEAIFYKVLDQCKKIVVGSGAHYLYYKRNDGIIRGKFVDQKYDYVNSTKEVVNYIQKKYPDIYVGALSKLLWSCLHIWVQIPNKNISPQAYKEIQYLIKKYRRVVLKYPMVRKKNKILLLSTLLGHWPIRMVYCMKR